MLRALRDLLAGKARGDDARGRPPENDEAFRVAAAALLVEAANADDDVHLLEQAEIAQGLAWHFGLDAAGVEDLLARAERARSEAIDMHSFTAVLVRGGDVRRRLELAEVVWRVVLADGEVTDDEGILARRIGNLLDLRPEDVAISIRRARGERTPYPTDGA
jgi:uncharacterized tellurite resistance protein B-like protein